eukprot:1678887-Prymnesium_polylepis.1
MGNYLDREETAALLCCSLGLALLNHLLYEIPGGILVRTHVRLLLLDHKHRARRKQDLVLGGKLRQHLDIGAPMESNVALAARPQLPQHIRAATHVLDGRAAVPAGRHEGGVHDAHQTVGVGHPRAALQLASNAAVQRAFGLCRVRHRGKLADGRADVADGGREGQRGRAHHVEPKVPPQRSDLAQKVVQWLVAWPRVQPHRKHLLQC